MNGSGGRTLLTPHPVNAAKEGVPTEADAVLYLFFSMLVVGSLVRISALAFGKFFERGCRIFFNCIRSAANRPFGVTPEVASDDFALIAVAFTHDIIILRDLWTVCIHKPSATRL
jgi:hypothetical protein